MRVFGVVTIMRANCVCMCSMFRRVGIGWWLLEKCGQQNTGTALILCGDEESLQYVESAKVKCLRTASRLSNAREPHEQRKMRICAVYAPG